LYSAPITFQVPAGTPALVDAAQFVYRQLPPATKVPAGTGP